MKNMNNMKTLVAGIALAVSSLTFAGGKDIRGLTYVQEVDASPSVAVYDVDTQRLLMNNVLVYYRGFYLEENFYHVALEWDADKGCLVIDEVLAEERRTSSPLVVITTPVDEDSDEESEEEIEEVE